MSPASRLQRAGFTVAESAVPGHARGGPDDSDLGEPFDVPPSFTHRAAVRFRQEHQSGRFVATTYDDTR